METQRRYSRQRETILKVLRGTDAHPRAEWVYQEVRKLIPNVSLGTVYRNLNQLVESGDLIRIKDDVSVRFDANIETHDHFHCSVCDSWFDISPQSTDLMSDLDPGAGFKVQAISLEMTGLCPDCSVRTD